MLLLCCALALVASCAAGAAAESDQAPLSWPPQVPAACNGTVNNIPDWTANAVLLNSTRNGHKLRAGDPHSGNPITLLHLYGTPYEQGYAYGELMREELFAMGSAFFDMCAHFLTQYCEQKLPDFKWACDILEGPEKKGIADVVRAYQVLTDPFTPPAVLSELQGMADASGYDYDTLVGLNLVPDIIKAGCSMVGAWAAATPGGAYHQLRALFLDPGLSVQKFPTVVVYHPPADTSDYGHAFVNVGFCGLVGTVTGYSSANVAISEKAFHAFNGTSSRIGIPFAYTLRNILAFDTTQEAAVARIAASRKTCPVYVGVGAGGTMAKVELGHNYTQAFSDKNDTFYPNHPQRDGLLWIDEFDQPSDDPCYYGILQDLYSRSNITAYNLVHILAPLAQTGGLHCVAWDTKEGHMYVANAAYPAPCQFCSAAAYDRQFVRFDLAALWSEPAPVDA